MPREWVPCIAYQQARLQEHTLLDTISVGPREKQRDIRSMFGGKGKEVPSTVDSGELVLKKKYQQGMTKLFRELDSCAKEERLPQFSKLYRKEDVCDCSSNKVE